MRDIDVKRWRYCALRSASVVVLPMVRAPIIFHHTLGDAGSVRCVARTGRSADKICAVLEVLQTLLVDGWILP
jgi:hypothetical protein